MDRNVKLLGFLFFFLPFLTFAQNQNIRFAHLTTDDGLIDNYCHAIFMDSKGYMWFATQGGLSRYDGISFKNFEQRIGDSTALTARIAMDIKEDQEGYMWIAMLGGGLNRFDPKTEKFKTFPFLNKDGSKHDHQPASKIFIDEEGRIWTGTYNMGLYVFDEGTQKFKQYDLMPSNNALEGFLKNTVHDIVEDVEDSNILWIAGNNGLYRFDKISEQIYYQPITYKNRVDTVSSFRNIYMDKAGELWLAVYGYGLVRYDIKYKAWSFYPHKPYDLESIDPLVNLTYDITPKSDTEFWISSKDEGLMSFDLTNHTYTFYKHNSRNQGSILSNDTEHLYKDPFGHIWIATASDGVSRIDPSMQIFDYTDTPIDSLCQALFTAEVYDAVLDTLEEKLYVVTTGCGTLIVYDKKKNKNPVYSYHINIADDVNARLNLFLDSQNRLWIVGVLPSNPKHLSLSIFDRKKKKLIPFKHKDLTEVPVQNYFISDMTEDKKGNLWFITFNGGLIKLDTSKDALVQYIQSESHPDYFAPSDIMNEIVEDKDGTFWISAYRAGLYHFDPATEELKAYHNQEPSKALVIHIAEDRHGRIWVENFKQGIFVIDTKDPEKKIQEFDIAHDLPDRSITEILRDQEGSIWLNSFKGVWKYDEMQNTFIEYDDKNTTTSNFFQKGFSLLNSGELLVGKTQGFNLFHPGEIYKNEIPPPIVFTGFQILDTLRLFDKPLDYMEQISLDYKDNFFSISFAALNFSQTDRNKYAYQLEGYNKDWIYPSDNRPLANYTGVPEGTYTFKVKAANNDGVWNEEGRSLVITIHPPWWRSLWAYLFYILLGSLIIYSVYRFLLSRRLAEAEALRLKELDIFKTKLYTNITHEFRTPLTVIQGMADTMKGDPEAKKLIRRNSKNLLHLVTQLLDMSKLESGKMELKMIRRNIISYLAYLTSSFQSYADTKKILLTFESDIPELVMDYDAEKLQHIIANLLSNAIKFTHNGGAVEVKISQSPALLNLKHNPLLKINIRDNGIGIPEEHLPHIFNRFYQVDDTHTRRATGTGIGLALTKELVEVMGGSITVRSEFSEGTEFMVLIPELHLPNTDPEIGSDADEAKTVFLENIGITDSKVPTIRENLATDTKTSDLPLLLLIEDNADVVAYIKTCLRDYYRIEVAYDGQAGIDKALEIVPDVIICDVMMPEKNGYEVTQFLKNDERSSHIPIIILTAKADVDSKVYGLSRGADAYLSKPFHKEELLIRLQKLIELRQKLQTRYAKLAPLPPTNDKALQIEDAFLKKVREAVEMNLEDASFNVAGLCKVVALSQPQLYRKVKALTNKSISSFIRTIRLQKGKVLLETTDLSVSEIAYDVGFTDPAYFSKTFSKEFGYPPSDRFPS